MLHYSPFFLFFPLLENASVDSDMDVLSDITVSSVHTSDLSSFEEESEEEPVISDSTEEGEITSDGKIIRFLSSKKEYATFLLSASYNKFEVLQYVLLYSFMRTNLNVECIVFVHLQKTTSGRTLNIFLIA